MRVILLLISGGQHHRHAAAERLQSGESDRNRSHLVRTVDGEQTEIPLKLDALLNKGDMSQNVRLRPGDVLVVPESRF
jgi:protein involved in polysaccharide export with SLBB domain